jgi:hypothetical protein
MLEDLLVNLGFGFGDLRSCFTNGCIPQPHKVYADEEGTHDAQGCPTQAVLRRSPARMKLHGSPTFPRGHAEH